MIQGIGVDVVQIPRIKQMIADYGQRFLDRCFTPFEQEQAMGYKDQAAYYAKRYAAKEAYAKAYGTGIGKSLAFTDMEIRHNEHGAPLLLHKQAGEQTVHLSLSDDDPVAIAMVVVEG